MSVNHAKTHLRHTDLGWQWYTTQPTPDGVSVEFTVPLTSQNFETEDEAKADAREHLGAAVEFDG